MSLPLRSLAKVYWYDPLWDKSSDFVTTGGVGRQGFCYTHWFVDPRNGGALYDPAEPPTFSDTYWRNMTDVTSISPYLVPELRGAIFPPKFVPTAPVTFLRPTDDDWAAEGEAPWGGNWRTLTYNADGGAYEVACWSPTNTNTVGYIRTKSTLPANASFIVRYMLFATENTEETTAFPKRRGLIVHVGSGTSKAWSIDLRSAATELSSDTYFNHNAWGLYRWTGSTSSRIDVAPSTAFGNHGRFIETQQIADDYFFFQPIGGYFRMETAGSPTGWVYSDPADPVGGASTGRSWVGVELHNCRGWVTIWPVAYSRFLDITTPSMSYADSFEQNFNWLSGYADFAVQSRNGNASISYAATYATNGSDGYYDVHITNNAPYTTYIGVSNVGGCVETPILYFMREIHPTITTNNTGYTASPAVSNDLSEFVEGIDISLDQSGRGHSARVLLRDLKINANGSYSVASNDTPSRICRGIGRVRIEMNHYDDAGSLAAAKTVAFEGYCSGLTYNDVGVVPQIELRLQDRTLLWNNGRATMALLPNLAGTNFNAAVRLVLGHWGVDLTNDVYYSSGDGSELLPLLDGSSVTEFDQSEDLQSVLDRICELVNYRWRLTHSNKICFSKYPDPLEIDTTAALAAAVFTVDPNVGDTSLLKVETPVTLSRDYSQVFNYVYAEGITPKGRPKFYFATVPPTVLTSTNDPQFTGRPLWQFPQEYDNTNPALTAYRQAKEALQQFLPLQVTMIGSNVLPWSVAHVTNVTNYPSESGYLFRVTGKTTVLKLEAGEGLWVDQLDLQPLNVY